MRTLVRSQAPTTGSLAENRLVSHMVDQGYAPKYDRTSITADSNFFEPQMHYQKLDPHDVWVLDIRPVMLDIDVSEGWARQLAHPRDTPAQLPTLPQSSMTPRAPALKSQSLAKIEWKEQRRAHTSPLPRLSIEPDQKSIAYKCDFDPDISLDLHY